MYLDAAAHLPRIKRVVDSAGFDLGNKAVAVNRPRGFVHKILAVDLRPKSLDPHVVPGKDDKVATNGKADLPAAVVGIVQGCHQLRRGIRHAARILVQAFGAFSAAHAGRNVYVLVLVGVGKCAAGVGPGQRLCVGKAARLHGRARHILHRPLSLVPFAVINPQLVCVHLQHKSIVLAQLLVKLAVAFVLLALFNVVVVPVIGKPQPVPPGNRRADALYAGILPYISPFLLAEIRLCRLAHAA